MNQYFNIPCLSVSYIKGPSKTSSDTIDSLAFPLQITSWFLILTVQRIL